jgi:CYTH domain-containing protein
MNHYLVTIYISATKVHATLLGKTELVYRKEFRLDLPDSEDLQERIDLLCGMVMDGERTNLIRGAGEKTVLVTELVYNEALNIYEVKE